MKRTLLLLILLTAILLLTAEPYQVNNNPNTVRVISTSAQQTVLEMTVGSFNREQVQINNSTYWALGLKKEGVTQESGMPQLPYITRSLTIPGTAKMQLQVISSAYTDIVMPVAPSKGILTRNVNPDDVAWTFAPFYQGNGFYPADLARLSEPFIIRDYRGITVYFQPFVYYPATQTLRVYTSIRLAVNNTGLDTVNLMTSAKSSASTWFDGIYRELFLNYNQAKYPVLDEEGRMLIITNSMFDTTLQPFIDWKRQKGFTVDVEDISVAGPSAAQLQTYIQNYYNLHNDLAFVQIIGDYAQVPSLTSGGGAADPSFALVAGTDSYPDLFIGRFSAQSTTDLETQVTRSIYYERDMPPNSDWLPTAMGIASSAGGGSQGDLGESDQTHIGNIRTDLINYGYTSVDQLYETQGASITQVANGVNAGRGFINYCGHGADTYWVTTGFSNTNVNQLTNSNKLPFIVSVACVNGNFAYQTCFAEAWLRARDASNGSPRGAVAFYGSSINQSWNSPMRAQDEITDLLIANQKNTIGGLFFNGSSRMIEVYSADGVNMYRTWHIFGDASLQVRTINPLPLTANYTSVLYVGANTFNVQTEAGARVTLYANGIQYGTGVADASGNALLNLAVVPDVPMDLTLTITAFNRVTLLGTVTVQASQGPYVQVDSQIITDGNNNRPDYNETFGYNLRLVNTGIENATGVSAVISTTDAYLTIHDNSSAFGDIPVGATVTGTDGFQIGAANNVPDQHTAIIHVIISAENATAWQYDVTLVLNAPVLQAGAMTIDDSQGNNNGRLDTGEVDIVTFPITNTGHADAHDLMCSLLVNNQVYYLLTPLQANFASLANGETVQSTFQITFSPQIPDATAADLLLIAGAGEYIITQNYISYLNLNIETFDSGTFTAYPWTFSGGGWIMDNVDPYSAPYSARSADITDSQTASLTIIMQFPTQGTVSFWKKVSSELNYDFLKFYINNVLQNQWSGAVDWSQESFTVPAGANTLRWDYAKDSIVSDNEDCAWVDDIIFPSQGGNAGIPILALSAPSLDFGTHLAADFTSMPLAITNNGDAALIGNIIGNEQFQVKPAQEQNYAQSVNFIIAAGQTSNFDVMIFPNTEGNLTGTLYISSDDPNHSNVSIPVSAHVQPVGNDGHVSATVTALKGNYPNPFSPETTISLSLKTEGQVRVDIYNILGQKVKTLVNESLKGGEHTYRWNGRDDSGRSVGSGIYFARMHAGSYEASTKMVMLK